MHFWVILPIHAQLHVIPAHTHTYIFGWWRKRPAIIRKGKHTSPWPFGGRFLCRHNKIHVCLPPGKNHCRSPQFTTRVRSRLTNTSREQLERGVIGGYSYLPRPSCRNVARAYSEGMGRKKREVQVKKGKERRREREKKTDVDRTGKNEHAGVRKKRRKGKRKDVERKN